MTSISAYIPCYNSASTISQAIESIMTQTRPVDELFIIDDASTDDSAQIVESMGVRLIRHSENLGRGAARARAMLEASHELVLCCDSNKTLDQDFVKRALTWFREDAVAAVCGRVTQGQARGVVDRWRGRHLFKMGYSTEICRRSALITGGSIVRKSSVIEVGNFNSTLRHSEDHELGDRLLSAGFDIVFDPQLLATSLDHNNFLQLMERYWRWHAGVQETVSLEGYLKQISFSIKIMAVQDIKAGDPRSVPISLFSPHYQFWRSWWRQQSRWSSNSKDDPPRS
jgi:glycosyltransferase involved in cell wall biosynthesis